MSTRSAWTVAIGVGMLLVAGCGSAGPAAGPTDALTTAPSVSPAEGDPADDYTATIPQAPSSPGIDGTTRPAEAGTAGKAGKGGKAGKAGKGGKAGKAERIADRASARTGAAGRVPRRAILEQLRDRAERIAVRMPSPTPSTLPTDVDADSNRGLGYRMMLEFGFGSEQWAYLDALWRRESGWNHLAENPSSGAYGIPQSLPGSKMAVVGADWRTNPQTQISWGLAYIAARYGSPQAAWAHSERLGWY